MKIYLLLLLTSLFPSVVMAQIVTDHLVSYWTFDKADIEGDEVKDAWGSNNGVIMGKPQIVAGKVGDALQFDGASEWIEVPRDPSLEFDENAVTMAAWVKALGGEDDWILYDGNGNSSGYALVYDNRAGRDSFGVSFWNEAGTRFNILGDGSHRYPMKEWHYVVGLLDGDKIRKYVDGKLEVETDFSGTIRKNAVDPLHIARYGFADGYFVNGVLDELTLYGKALSDNEIFQNFNAKGLAVAPKGKLPTAWGAIKHKRGMTPQ